MATASPTPLADGLVRRTSARQPSRRPVSRSMATRSEQYQHSELRVASSKNTSSQSQSFDNDSSEDEIPVPMKLSALTKALLDDAPEQPVKRPSPPRTRARSSALNASTSSATQERRQMRSSLVQEPQEEEERRSSKPPSPAREPSHEPSPVRKRVVRLSHNPQGFGQIEPSKRRSNSSTRAAQRSRPTSWQDRSADAPESQQPAQSAGQAHSAPREQRSEINTPSQPRVVRIVTGSSGKRSRVGSTDPSSAQSRRERSLYEKSGGTSGDEDYNQEGPETIARNAPAVSFGSISRYNRGRSDESGNPMSSMRIKRAGKLSGAYLSGPARRGGRRTSGRDGEEGVEGESIIPDQQTDRPVEQAPAAFFGDGLSNFNSGSPVSGSAAAARAGRKQASSADLRGENDRLPPSKSEPQILEDSPPKIWVPKLPVTASRDQENEVPASYRRTKPSVDQVLEKISQTAQGIQAQKPKTVSPERKVLSSISHNTPLRAAPPPPKMSALDAPAPATATATTEKVRARRNILKVNGKCYTRLDCLGRGGSAKVYRVTDESGKLFALKRVSLENADESTVRGFKGEIDLLLKLKPADRVIDLVDYEMNDEKKILSLVSTRHHR